MKIKLLLVVLLISGVWACSNNDDDSGNDGPSFQSRFSATINGERFEATSIFDSIQVISNTKNLFIGGQDASGRSLSLRVNGFQTTGIFTINNGFSTISYFTDTSNEFICDGSDGVACGTINLLSDDGVEMRGTFSAELTSENDPNDVITISDGEFIAEYYLD